MGGRLGAVMIRRISVILAAMIVGRGMGIVGLRVSGGVGSAGSGCCLICYYFTGRRIYMYGEVEFSSIRESTLSSGYDKV